MCKGYIAVSELVLIQTRKALKPMLRAFVPVFLEPLYGLLRPITKTIVYAAARSIAFCAIWVGNYFPHLPSNAQDQTRRFLPHVSLKSPYGQMPHLPSHWKLTT